MTLRAGSHCAQANTPRRLTLRAVRKLNWRKSNIALKENTKFKKYIYVSHFNIAQLRAIEYLRANEKVRETVFGLFIWGPGRIF